MVVLGDSMATTSVQSEHSASKTKELIGFDEAMERLSRDERFRATVYAMNTLLVQKGIYSPEEFEFQFRQVCAKAFALAPPRRWFTFDILPHRHVAFRRVAALVSTDIAIGSLAIARQELLLGVWFLA
jgi:hypothetical protein